MRTHKTTSLLILLLFAVSSTQANAPGAAHWHPFMVADNGQLYYQKVIDLPGLCQSDLLQKAKVWISRGPDTRLISSNNSKAVIVGNGTGNFSYRFGLTEVTERIYYVLKLEIKDDKLRYTFSDFVVRNSQKATYLEDYTKHPWIAKDGRLRNQTVDIKEGILNEILKVSNSLQTTIAAKDSIDIW